MARSSPPPGALLLPAGTESARKCRFEKHKAFTGSFFGVWYSCSGDPARPDCLDRTGEKSYWNEEPHSSAQARVGADWQVATIADGPCAVRGLFQHQSRACGGHCTGDEYRPECFHDAKSRAISPDDGGNSQGER